MGSQLLEGLRMRLTLVIFFTTFSVAKAKQKPAAEPPMVKATEAVKVRSSSSGQENSNPTHLSKNLNTLPPHNASRQALQKTCGVNLKPVQCNTTQFWFKKEPSSTMDEAYSYCPEKGSRGGTPPFQNGPNNWRTGNYVESLVLENGAKLRIEEVCAENCNPKPPGCDCRSLLQSLITFDPPLIKKTGTIELFFSPDGTQSAGLIKACRCYLGTAARNDFKKVELEDCPEDGKTEVVHFDKQNYDKKCEEIVKKPCSMDTTWWIQH